MLAHLSTQMTTRVDFLNMRYRIFSGFSLLLCDFIDFSVFLFYFILNFIGVYVRIKKRKTKEYYYDPCDYVEILLSE